MLHSLLTIVLLFAVAASGASLHSFEAGAPDSAHHHVRRSVLITLQRTVCFGACPEYKLTIFTDGRVLYEGIRSVKTKGIARGRISRSKLDELILEFDNIYYFNLEDSYTPGTKACPQSMTDMPSAITSLTRDGKSKTITHYHGCRGSSTLERLTQLENKIDEAVNVSKWTK